MERRSSESRFFASQLAESTVLALPQSQKAVTFSFSSGNGCSILFQYSDKSHNRTAKGQFQVSICYRLHENQMKKGLMLDLVTHLNNPPRPQRSSTPPPPSSHNGAVSTYEARMTRTIIVAPRTSVVRAVRVVSRDAEAPVRPSCIAPPPFDFPLFVPLDFVFSAEVAVAPSQEEFLYPPSPPSSPRDGRDRADQTVQTRVVLHCRDGCYVSSLKGRFALCQLTLLQLPYNEAVELIPLILKGSKPGESFMNQLELGSNITTAMQAEQGKAPSTPTECSGYTRSVQSPITFNKYSSILHVSQPTTTATTAAVPTPPPPLTHRIPRVMSTESMERKRSSHHHHHHKGGENAFAPSRRTQSNESLQDLAPPTWFPPIEENGFDHDHDQTPPLVMERRRSLQDSYRGPDGAPPHYDIPITRASPALSSPCTCSETSDSDLSISGSKIHDPAKKARYDSALLRQLQDRTKSMNQLQKELLEQKERNVQLEETHAAEKAKLAATSQWLSKGQRQFSQLDSLLEPMKEMPNSGSTNGRSSTVASSGAYPTWPDKEGNLVPPVASLVRQLSDGSSNLTHATAALNDRLHIVDSSSVEVSCTTSHQASPTTPGLHMDFGSHLTAAPSAAAAAADKSKVAGGDAPFPTPSSNPSTAAKSSTPPTPHHSSRSSAVISPTTGAPCSPADIKPFHRQQPNLGVVTTAARHGPFANVGSKRSAFKVSREELDGMAAPVSAVASPTTASPKPSRAIVATEKQGTRPTLASTSVENTAAARPTTSTEPMEVPQTRERTEEPNNKKRKPPPLNHQTAMSAEQERSLRERDLYDGSKRRSESNYSIATSQGSYPMNVNNKTPAMSLTSVDSHAGRTPNALLADTLRPVTPPFLSLTKTTTSMIT